MRVKENTSVYNTRWKNKGVKKKSYKRFVCNFGRILYYLNGETDNAVLCAYPFFIFFFLFKRYYIMCVVRVPLPRGRAAEQWRLFRVLIP